MGFIESEPSVAYIQKYLIIWNQYVFSELSIIVCNKVTATEVSIRAICYTPVFSLPQKVLETKLYSTQNNWQHDSRLWMDKWIYNFSSCMYDCDSFIETVAELSLNVH